MSPQTEKRILKHLKAGVHLAEILKIEGLDPGNARKNIRQIAAKNKLPLRDGPRGLTETAEVPFCDASTMRRLSWFVTALSRHYSREELCSTIGLTRAEQHRACGGKHDFTLSQLIRIGLFFDMNPASMFHMAQKSSIGEAAAFSMKMQQWIPKEKRR